MKTSSADIFKKNLDKAFLQPGVKLNQSTMADNTKYKASFSEEKLEGGLADKKSLLDIAMKHSFGDKVLTSSKKIERLLRLLQKELQKGIEVELEHTKDREKAKEIAMDHLFEDPKYYQKLKKIETNEQAESIDKRELYNLAKKHVKTEDGKKIVDMYDFLKSELEKGIKIEMKNTKDKERAKKIAMNNLSENPKYYEKSKKIETKEEDKVSAKKQFASDLQKDKDYIEFKKNSKYKKGGAEFTFGVPNVTSDDPYIKKRKWSRPGKEETTEATSSGSSGAFSGPIAFKDSEFLRKSFAETPKLKEGLEIDGDVEKIEATEVTTSGSVGGYESPSMWAKTTKKKDWGPSRKTQIPGGAFVKVKKKCTKFPYCNQGDINALKLSKNESVKEAIKNISKKYKISESIIINILESEFSKLNKSK